NTEALIRGRAGGQAAASSNKDVKPRGSREAKSSPQHADSDQNKETSRSSSSTATRTMLSSSLTNTLVAQSSNSPIRPEQTDSAALPLSSAHISPDWSRTSIHEMKARNLRDVHVPAVQEAQIRPSGKSRGQALSPSRDNAKATAPSTPLAARAINPLGMRDAEAVNSVALVAEDREQRRKLDFERSGGRRVVSEKRGEGVSCKSSADARDLMSVALPRRFGERSTSPGASAAGHVTVSLRAEVSSRSSRDSRGHSARSTNRTCYESCAQSLDSNGRCHPLRAIAGGLSPSPSTALRRQATCEPPDKTNSNDSSLRSGQSTLRPRSATVPSAAPPFRSSYLSMSESGPDSANWRARGWLKASSRQEVGAVEADSRDRSISKCEKDSPHGGPHRSHWETSSQASAQDRPQVYAGGQVLTSSLQDGKPESSRGAGKCLPRSARSDTTATVTDDPLVQFPDSGHVSRPDADHPSSSSSATPRILGARKPPDKTLNKSSLHRLSRSGPDSANWRARRQPVALLLHDMDTTNPDQQKSVSSRSDHSSCGTRDRRWHSPQPDVVDSAASRAIHLHFHASARGPNPERPEDDAGDLKRVHAGGQTALSSCKDVKPPDVREVKKDPPQFIALGSKGQRLPSLKLNPATPRTYGRGDFALRCSGSGIGDGREVLCCSPDCLPLSTREAETVEQPYESGSGAKDEVSFFNGRGDNSPANTAWDFGRGTHARDSEAVSVFALPSARAPLDIAGRDEARRQTGILHRANVEWLEAHRDHAHPLLVVHMRRFHRASSTSALQPLRKDQEADVPDARALLPPRRPQDKRVGGNGLILHAEKPSRASSHAEVSDASTTACSSCSDATPQPGGRIGLAVMDGGCGMGYALGFSNNPGELIRAASSGDGNLSDVSGAQAVVPSPACPSTRKVVRHAERIRTTFCLRGSSEEVFSVNQEALARFEDCAGPASGICARSKHESAHEFCRDVYTGPAEKISAFQAAQEFPRRSGFALCEGGNALLDVVMLPHPSLLALCVKCRPLHGGEVSLRRARILSQQTHQISPFRAARLRHSCARDRDGNMDQDLSCLFADQDLPAALEHKTHLFPHRAPSTTAVRRSRPSQTTAPRHSLAQLRKMGAYCKARRFEHIRSTHGWGCMKISHGWRLSVAFSRVQEAGGQVSQYYRAVYDPPCAQRTPRHGRYSSQRIEERLNRRRRVGPYGPAPLPLGVPHLRLVFPLIALIIIVSLGARSSPDPSARPIRLLRSQPHLIHASQPDSLLFAFVLGASSCVPPPAWSWTLRNGFYIRSTPPDIRARTANGGAQGEVLPCSGCEEDMTSIWASALWPAGHGQSLNRGAPRLENLKNCLLGERLRAAGTGRVASRLVVEYNSDAGVHIFDLTRARRYTRTTRYPSAPAPDCRQRATTPRSPLPARLARSPLAGTELP
ncbi:hypothetical protein FB107DRAFT_175147, partial [Schizophyllum commune]